MSRKVQQGGITKTIQKTSITPVEVKQEVKKELKEHIIMEYEDPVEIRTRTYNLIKKQRERLIAPVDSMGCSELGDTKAPEPIFRYQILISLMLSSQTRDEMTYRAMERLRKHGLTPKNIANTEEEKLKELIINCVGFYNRKAVYIKETTNTLLEKYEGDIPTTVEELMTLKGVGPKMAFLTANCAWKRNFGIGVDVHVHRICNRLGWVSTSKPEETRKSLEEWLPREQWNEINYMLVGFGQTVCKNSPRCQDCDISHICPSAFPEKPIKSKGKSKSKSKSKVKKSPKIETEKKNVKKEEGECITGV